MPGVETAGGPAEDPGRPGAPRRAEEARRQGALDGGRGCPGRSTASPSGARRASPRLIELDGARGRSRRPRLERPGVRRCRSATRSARAEARARRRRRPRRHCSAAARSNGSRPVLESGHMAGSFRLRRAGGASARRMARSVGRGAITPAAAASRSRRGMDHRASGTDRRRRASRLSSAHGHPVALRCRARRPPRPPRPDRRRAGPARGPAQPHPRPVRDPRRAADRRHPADRPDDRAREHPARRRGHAHRCRSRRVLANAPARDGDFIVVPAILDER